jgi:tRNA1(Val) A37 N6-methylase TrmN6
MDQLRSYKEQVEQAMALLRRRYRIPIVDREVEVPDGERADIVGYVIREGKKVPYVVVEVKENIERVRIDQAKLQSFALQAPYFGVTDLTRWFWFKWEDRKTVEISDLPSLPPHRASGQIKPDSGDFRHLVWSLSNQIRGRGLSVIDQFEAVLALLVLKVLDELLASKVPTHASVFGTGESLPRAPSRDEAGLRTITSAAVQHGFIDLKLSHFIETTLEAFGENEGALLDAHRYLSPYILFNSGIDPRGLFAEISPWGSLGTATGFFFTPPLVSEFMASLMKPKNRWRVFDPASGSGGLLVDAFRRVKKSGHVREVICDAMDIDARMTSLTLLTLGLAGAVEMHLWTTDFLSDSPHGFRGEYDAVLCNPPFGSTSSQSVALKESQFASPGSMKVPVEALFIERSLNLTKPGGLLCFVVPKGLLFRRGIVRDFRRFLLENARLLAVVGLPAGMFRPITSIETSVVLLRKERTSDDYEVFMGTAREEPNGEGSNLLTEILPALLAWMSDNA